MLKSLRSPLERCGAIVAQSIVYEEPHRHTSLLARWDQVHPEPTGGAAPRQALRDLFCAGVRAAVGHRLVDELVSDGRLVRVDGHLATASAR